MVAIRKNVTGAAELRRLKLVLRVEYFVVSVYGRWPSNLSPPYAERREASRWSNAGAKDLRQIWLRSFRKGRKALRPYTAFWARKVKLISQLP